MASRTLPANLGRISFDEDNVDTDFSERYVYEDDIPLLFDEIRDRYTDNLNGEVQLNEEPTPAEQETEAEFEHALNRLQDRNADKTRSCASCSKQVLIENVQCFRKGQHIAMSGKIGTSYNRKLRKQKHSYQHHAIIKEVKAKSGTRVTMELIHFTKERNKIKIYKTTETYDLVYDEIKIVEYDHPRYASDEIVQRAESMIPENEGDSSLFEKYNPFTRNCEHFATWCVVGEGQSLQVHSLRESIGEGLKSIFGDGSVIVKGLLRLLFISSDEIAGALTRAVNVPEFVLGGAAALYLLYCIVMTVMHVKDYGSGHMCWTCLKRKLADLWLAFGVFGATSAVTFVIFHFALPLLNPVIGIPLIIMLILVSALLQWSVPKIHRALKSPFSADKIKVEKLSELEVGDIVSMYYYGIPHLMILTEIQEDNSESNTGRLCCVHYGLPSFFGRRKVIEEYFNVNLRKDSVKRLDCRHLLCHSGNTVVTRARKRLGETKWALTNRSDHLSYWAKVRQRPRGMCEEWDNSGLEPSKSKKLSSLFIEKTEVHLMDEIQNGDVLQHEKVGILASKASLDGGFGRQFEIELVFYDKGWWVRSKKFTVDLNTDNMYVKRFHPAHCHPMITRVQRAKDWLDKKGLWWTTDGFIENCIMLDP